MFALKIYYRVPNYQFTNLHLGSRLRMVLADTPLKIISLSLDLALFRSTLVYFIIAFYIGPLSTEIPRISKRSLNGTVARGC